MILPFRNKTPRISDNVFIAPTAVIIGDVVIHPGANIWFGAVLRGDMNQIMIGANTSIQDNSVLHCNEHYATIVGANCIVGHGAIMEGCTIGDSCMIGMNATVLSGSVIGAGSIVAAAALVREFAEFPAQTLITGVPAAVKRNLTDEQFARIQEGVDHYGEIMQEYENILRSKG